jgi:hypothetical protein
MFTEYHVIQFILHGLIAKLKYFQHKKCLWSEIWYWILSQCKLFIIQLSPREPPNHWTEFHDSWYLNVIRTAVREIQGQRSCDSNTTVCHDDWRIFCVLFRSAFIVRGNVSVKISREIKHTLYDKKYFFRKSWQLRYNAEKYCSVLWGMAWGWRAVAYCEVWLGAEEL